MAEDKDNSLDKLDSASKRLKHIIDTLGVKQSHMAAKLGLSPSGLHYILNNEVKFSKNAKKIAEYLNINEDWLTSGEGDIYCDNTDIKTYAIPIYYPDQLKLNYTSPNKTKIKPHDFQVTTTNYSHPIVGIYVTETEFIPKFEIGDIVAFEQREKFLTGEIILVYLASTNDIVIKIGFCIEDNIFLTSPTGDSLKFQSEKGDLLLGVYRECFKKTNFI